MKEAGHESVEEDLRGSVSEGLFRPLPPPPARELRTPSHLLQSASEPADKQIVSMIGVNQQDHAPRGSAARKCAPRAISNAKKRPRCLPIVSSSARLFLKFGWQQRQNIWPSIISSEHGRRAFGR